MAMTQRDRRALVILGLVVVVGAAVFLLGGNRGGGGANQAAAVPGTQVGTQVGGVGAQTSPEPAPSPSPSKKKHGEKLVFSGRDPFDATQGGGTLVSTESTTTTTSTTVEPSVSPAGSPSPGPSGGSSQTFGDQTVVLVSIFIENGLDKAQVEVDGTVYTVSPGDTFAGSFQLVGISGSCADFLYGDQAFTLCETANK
jgi:hypothetical protein